MTEYLFQRHNCKSSLRIAVRCQKQHDDQFRHIPDKYPVQPRYILHEIVAAPYHSAASVSTTSNQDRMIPIPALHQADRHHLDNHPTVHLDWRAIQGGA